jgi:hypothetical protein
MENVFITKNTTTGQFQSVAGNFVASKKFRDFLATAITSEEEYIAWVRQWKAYEKEATLASRFFKAQSRLYLRKYTNEETSSGYFHYRSQRLTQRWLSSAFYEKRAENKKLLKESNFFKPEVINTDEPLKKAS